MNKHPLITHVLWALERGGAERVVLDLARRLPSRGFRVRVLTVCGSGAMKPLFEQAGIDLRVGPHGSRAASVRFLREEIRKERPAVWHTHLGADLWGGWAAQREGMKPWIVTLHNEDRDLSFGYHLARRAAYHFADHVVCVSDAVRYFAKNKYHVRDEKLLVIPNGIDATCAVMRPSRAFHDVPRLVTVGRLVLQKDQTTLLKALSRVHRPWRLYVIGEGSERLPLQELAASLGILPRAHFVGAVDDVPQRLANADLFCFPSRWEGQAIALLEAAAARVPILASDLPVIREMFDESAVTFAAPGAVTEWAAKIEGILSNPSDALAKTARAAEIVEKNFSLDASVEKYARLYRKVLANGGKRF